MSIFGDSRDCRLGEVGAILPDQFLWIAQQFRRGDILGKFCAQKSFIGRVLKQPPYEVGHSREQLSDRAVFANAITHFDQRALDRPGHAIQELKLETAAIDSEFVRERLRVRDAANIVRPERSGNDRFVFQ